MIKLVLIIVCTMWGIIGAIFLPTLLKQPDESQLNVLYVYRCINNETYLMRKSAFDEVSMGKKKDANGDVERCE